MTFLNAVLDAYAYVVFHFYYKREVPDTNFHRLFDYIDNMFPLF